MPTASPEQIDAVETSTNALMALSKIAFSSIEQLAALNLKVAQTALTDAVAATELLSHPQDIPALHSGESPLTGPAARKVVAYFSDAQGIAAKSQDEINRLMSTYFALPGKSTPPGKSWSSGFDMFTRIAQQASSLASANAKAVGTTTERLLAASTTK
jgi:phasin family protein